MQEKTLIIVGAASTGKKCFAQRLFGGTDSISFKDPKSDLQLKLKYQICKNIEELPSSIFGIIIVYNITDKISFIEAQKFCKTIEESKMYPLRAVVGTFRDRDQERQISMEQGQHLKQQINGIFFEVASPENLNIQSFKNLLQIRAVYIVKDNIQSQQLNQALSNQQEKNLNFRSTSPNLKQIISNPFKKDQSSDKLKTYDITICVYGDKMTGKKSLIMNLLDGKNYISVNDSKLQIQAKINIIPIANLSAFNVQKDFGLILVYDISNLLSYVYIEKEIAQINSQKPIFKALVGTHLDQENDNRQVTLLQGQELKSQILSVFAEVSNKTMQNMDLLKKQIQVKCINQLNQLKQTNSDEQYQISLLPQNQANLSDNFINKFSHSPKSMFSSANDQNDADIKEMTVYLVGQFGVGKKTLLNSILNNAAYLMVRDPNSDIQFKLFFDVASRLIDIPNNAFGVILCYDITNHQSFDYIQQFQQQLNNFDLLPVRALVGCFHDEQQNRQVSLEAANYFKKLIRSTFYEISNTTGQNIESFKKQFMIRCVYGIKDKEQNNQAEAYLTNSQLNAHSSLNISENWNQPQVAQKQIQENVQKKLNNRQSSQLEQLNELRPEDIGKQNSVIQNQNILSKSIQQQINDMANPTISSQTAQYPPNYKQKQELLKMIFVQPSNTIQHNPQQMDNIDVVQEQFPNQQQILNGMRSKKLVQSVPPQVTYSENGDRIYSMEEVEQMNLRQQKSRICNKVVPEINYNKTLSYDTQAKFETNPDLLNKFVQKLQPTRQLITAQRLNKKPQFVAKYNATHQFKNKLEAQTNEIVIVIEFEVGKDVLSIPVRRNDNPYQLAKQFVEDYQLDTLLIKQITGIIMQRIEQYLSKEKKDLLQSRNLMHKTRQFDVPSGVSKLNTDKIHEKTLFKFELQIGNRSQMIAYRKNDNVQKLADKFIKLMQIDREQYYNYVVAKIQESVALYQMQQDQQLKESEL